MKKAALLFIGLVFGLQLSAQRFGIVDSEFILSKMPEYREAQSTLDNFSTKWEGEVAALRSEVDAMSKAYYAEKILLTEDMQAKREEAIKKKELEAMDLQRKYFGAKGDIYSRRQELVQPLQDLIYNAVLEVARKKKLDVVFDKSSDLITLYDNGRADISDDVLKVLGYE